MGNNGYKRQRDVPCAVKNTENCSQTCLQLMCNLVIYVQMFLSEIKC